MSGLDALRITAELERLGCRLGPLHVVAATASTNDDARALARAGCAHGTLVLADTQTAGRGRGAHRWHSPPGDGIYLSLVWRPTLAPSRLALLALAAGVGVARAVDGLLLQPRARLKWPNDVYVDDRKVGGILVEAQLNSRGATAIVGVGVNVHTRQFPEELASSATSLALAGAMDAQREFVAARLISAIEVACREVEGTCAAAVLDELAARDWLLGRSVLVGELRGRASGIDGDGRLLLRDSVGSLHGVVAGEVSLLLDRS